MPPMAPAIGSATCEGCDSEPSTTSRLISSPTSRKKSAISPSLIHSTSGLLRSTNFQERPSLVSSRLWTGPANGELARTSASSAAARSGSADAASLSMNSFSRFGRTSSPGQQNARALRPGRPVGNSAPD